MDGPMTRYQVPRGARADAEDNQNLYLIKNVGRMRLTYQVRVLAARAIDEGRRLVIVLPRGARVSGPLRAFIDITRPNVTIQRAP